MSRRRFLSAAVALGASAALALLAAPAHAAGYLDRAGLLLDQARREGDLVRVRLHDKELIGIVKTLSEARVQAVRKMEVPPAVARAHPHFLLVLENSERAILAAEQGNFKKFVEHLHLAREEDRTFRAVLATLGHRVPDPKP